MRSSSTARAAPPASHTFLGLDALRGLAALVVLLYHARNSSFVNFGALPSDDQTLIAAGAFAITRFGHEAVLVFFTLSGFLVGGQVVRRSLDRTFDAAQYSIDRMTRIMLPLVPACLLTVTINWLVYGHSTNLFVLAANMVGLNGALAPTLPLNQPLWSLAYEIWFYVVAGAIGVLLIRPTSIVAMIAAALGVLVFTRLSAHYLLLWMFAVVAIFNMDDKHATPKFIAGLVLCALGVAQYQLGSDGGSQGLRMIPTGAAAEACVCIGVTAMIPLICRAEVNALLRWAARPIAFLSGMSYTLYLTHFPVLRGLERLIPIQSSLSYTSIMLFVAKLAISLMVAVLFYVLFERNTGALRRQVKRMLARRKRTAPALESSQA